MSTQRVAEDSQLREMLDGVSKLENEVARGLGTSSGTTVDRDLQRAFAEAAATAQRCERESKQLAALTDLLTRLQGSETAEAGCQVLASGFQELLGCAGVSVALCDPQTLKCRLVGQAGLGGDTYLGNRQLAQYALQEAVLRRERTSWPPLSTGERQGLLAQRQYCESERVESLVTTILRDHHGEIQGVWMMVGERRVVQSPHAMAFCDASQTAVASGLGLLVRARQSRWQVALKRFSGRLKSRPGKAALIVCGLLFVMMAIPMRYRVSAECQVEPVQQRFIAAPFTGRLQQAFVRPGEVVTQGQLLAQMDGQELRWEMAAIEAELQRAKKELAGHTVAHDSGKATVAKYEVEKLEHRYTLMKQRQGELEIRSPFAGCIVAGDLERSAGRPFEIGETLFEVAPLQEMIVEIHIPELDWTVIECGQREEITFDAFPWQQWSGEIQRIHPRAELKEQVNGFIAEVRIENGEQSLRPGMRGEARIATVYRPMGWNLLHRPALAVIRWLGW